MIFILLIVFGVSCFAAGVCWQRERAYKPTPAPWDPLTIAEQDWQRRTWTHYEGMNT